MQLNGCMIMTTSMDQRTDRIEKTTVLHAPQGRVWRALTDHTQFATWFGTRFDEPFTPGRTLTGRFTYRGRDVSIDFVVERMDPEHYFAYRWHPYAIDPGADYSAEPMTLVEFRLKAVPEGTALTITESGFDRIPAHRRDEAYRMDDRGWTAQVENLRRHVAS